MRDTGDGRETKGRHRESIPKGLPANSTFKYVCHIRSKTTLDRTGDAPPQDTGNFERSQLKNVCRGLDCLEIY